MRIAIDFDGTIVQDIYPLIGPLRKDAKEVINKLYDDGHTILINTCRSGKYEEECAVFLLNAQIDYHEINENLPEDIKAFGNTNPRKLGAEIYIDDKAINGIPSWKEIYKRVNEISYKSK